MTHRRLALALLAPALWLAACGGPLLSAEVKEAKITSTNVPFSSPGGGAISFGSFTADLGPLGASSGSGFTTALTLKQVTIAWTDPATRPDFSGITSATLTAVPAAGSGAQERVVATYVQSASDPNPAGIVIAGDPSLNVLDYLADGVLELRLDVQGTPPATAWAATATVVAELAWKAEYSP